MDVYIKLRGCIGFFVYVKVVFVLVSIPEAVLTCYDIMQCSLEVDHCRCKANFPDDCIESMC